MKRALKTLMLSLLVIPFALVLTACDKDKKREYDFIVNPGESIQLAINQARPDDEILVKAGVYNEQLIIDKDLEITGEGNVVIAGPTDYRTMTYISEVDTYALVVVKDNADVTINNVTIKGDPAKAIENAENQEVGQHNNIPWTGYSGVLVYGAELDLNRVTILDIALNPGTMGLNQMANAGYGVRVIKSQLPTIETSLDMEDCTIKNFQRCGVQAQAGTEIDLERCVIEGQGNVDTVAQRGVQIYGVAKIEYCAFVNLNYTPNNEYKAVGIYSYQYAGMIIKLGNTFTNVQVPELTFLTD